MNIVLFDKIKEKILDDPSKLEMIVYKFGSQRCIAGWALDLATKEEISENKINDVFGLEGENAAKLLGITIAESMLLFPLAGWPKLWYQEFYQTKPFSKERSQVVVNRIDYFIEYRK